MSNVVQAQGRLGTSPDDTKASLKRFAKYLETHIIPAYDTFEMYMGSEQYSEETTFP